MVVGAPRVVDGAAVCSQDWPAGQREGTFLHRIEVERDGWLAARETFEVPAGTRRMQVQMRGTFVGGLEIKNISLRSKGP